MKANKPKETCPKCDGEGEVSTTDRAAYYPGRYQDEVVDCDQCVVVQTPKVLGRRNEHRSRP